MLFRGVEWRLDLLPLLLLLLLPLLLLRLLETPPETIAEFGSPPPAAPPPWHTVAQSALSWTGLAPSSSCGTLPGAGRPD